METLLPAEKSISNELNHIRQTSQELYYQKLKLIEKGMKSDNPKDIIEANKAYNEIAPKVDDNNKSFLIDPLEFTTNLGYKDKMYSLSYGTLKRMAKTPIISTIIKTRKNQVADFAEPQSNKYANGFVIRKKGKEDNNLTNEDKRTISQITDFILNCGMNGVWDTDDFDTWIRKMIDDSLTFDQMTFEVVRSRRGRVEKFIATDAATHRIADTAFRDNYQNDFIKRGAANRSQFFTSHMNIPDYKGYPPSYVQVYQNAVVNEYYPWELCFGVRNPSTSIYSNGYGLSELEELINVVTSMLWGDEYNRKFFSQGSAPKGLLRVKGNTNERALQQFKQQWQAMISGVMQSWKTPVVEADIDWIDLQKNNRDMEYTAWMEYLIKLSCGIYSIDPTEIGWDISKSGGGGMFEGSQEQRLTHSKDKGLYPLLKFLQRKINKYIVSQLSPEFEFVFVGINGMTMEKELELDVKKAGSFTTINETREKWGLEPIENGDIIENSVYWQAVSAQQQAAQQQAMNKQSQEQVNPFDDATKNENPFDAYADEVDETEKADLKDVFIKAFDNFLKEE